MLFHTESYQTDATEAYGKVCEFFGCGWNLTTCDVHHIDYQEQQECERKMRALADAGQIDSPMFQSLQLKATSNNWGTYNAKTRQLLKNDDVLNLTVLCPNHHRFVHHHDMGKMILHFIPPRKEE